MVMSPRNSTTSELELTGPMIPESFSIRKVTRETADTFTMEMERANGGDGFSFLPGQFNMLYVFGVGEVPISISGDPDRPQTLIHTTREVGTVTSAMRRLKAGQCLGVRGPFGTSWPVEEADGHDVLIVAGGIGMAPLRPVVYYLLSHRERYGKVVLLYGARTPEEILFGKELERWRSRSDIEVHLTVDRATSPWRHNVGVVTTLIPRWTGDPHHCVAMVCGPEIMMRFTLIELDRRCISEDRIYLSMERNMKCGVGLCGHCQLGARFVCKDGPVYRCDSIREVFSKREL